MTPKEREAAARRPFRGKTAPRPPKPPAPPGAHKPAAQEHSLKPRTASRALHPRLDDPHTDRSTSGGAPGSTGPWGSMRSFRNCERIPPISSWTLGKAIAANVEFWSRFSWQALCGGILLDSPRQSTTPGGSEHGLPLPRGPAPFPIETRFDVVLCWTS